MQEYVQRQHLNSSIISALWYSFFSCQCHPKTTTSCLRALGPKQKCFCLGIYIHTHTHMSVYLANDSASCVQSLPKAIMV